MCEPISLEKLMRVIVCLSAAAFGACSTGHNLSKEITDTIAVCSIGLSTKLGAEVEAALSRHGQRVTAGFREEVRGAFFSTLKNEELAVTQYSKYLACVSERNPSKAVSASVALFTGSYPEELTNRPEWLARYTRSSRGRQHLLEYVSSANDQELKISPQLPYLDGMKSDGPILPLWMDDFFFPPPVLGFLVNNPTDSGIAISSIELQLLERSPTKVPWITVSSPRYTEGKPITVMFRDYAFDDLSSGNPRIEYNIVPIADNAVGLDTGDCCVAEIEKLLHLPGLDFEKPVARSGAARPRKGQRSEAARASDDWESIYGDSAEFLIDETLLPNPAHYSTALLFGWLSYSDIKQQERRFRFATRIFLHPPGGPGRISPSWLYHLRIPSSGDASTVSIGISQTTAAHSQDYFLLALDTDEPARLKFRVVLRITGSQSLDLGVVELETFFTKYEGAGGVRQKAPAFYTTEALTRTKSGLN